MVGNSILDFLSQQQPDMQPMNGMDYMQPQTPAMPNNDMVKQILSARFQPTAQDVGNAALAGISNNTYVNPQQFSDQRMQGVMQTLASIDKMNMLQLELSKINEEARHNRATEGLNPQGLPITNGPSFGGQSNPTQNLMMPNLIQTESGGNPNALSPKGAAGTFQIMPDTAANPGYGVTPLRWWDGKDPRTAPQMEQERFANDYLNAMQIHNGGNQQLAAASYNAGPGAVDRVGGNISQLPQETQNYVAKVAPENQPMMGGKPRLQPSVNNGFMPLFRGNEIMKDNLPSNFAYVQNPEGGIKAQQIPGTIEKGSNGEILQTDSQGNVTQQIPQNPTMKAKLEQNLQKIADRFNELRKIGGTVEDITETNPVAALGAWTNNKGTQLAASEGLDISGTTVLPGGQTLLQGTKAATLRGEIRDLIKQTAPLYMQAMGITPGMERAVSAQQMLQDALGGAVGKSRQQNMYSLGNLSTQAGTGILAHAMDAINAGADPDAVMKRLRSMQE